MADFANGMFSGTQARTISSFMVVNAVLYSARASVTHTNCPHQPWLSQSLPVPAFG